MNNFNYKETISNLYLRWLVLANMIFVCQAIELNIQDFHYCFNDIMIVDSLKGTGDSALRSYYYPESGYSISDVETFVSMNHSCVAELPHCIMILHRLPQVHLSDSMTKANSILSESKGRGCGFKPVVLNFFLPALNTSEFEQESWSKYSSDRSIPIDSDFYYLLLSAPTNVSSVWESYSVKSATFWNEVIQQKETEKEKGGFQDTWYSLTSKVGRRHDFRGIPIVVIVRNGTGQYDWMNYKLDRRQEIELLDGFSVRLIRDFQKLLNFSMKALLGDIVATLPNNTLGGRTMELLRDKTADISLSQSAIVPFRAKFVSFLQPSYLGLIHVFFKQPSPSSISDLVYAPFSLSVWASLGISWVSMLILIKINLILKSTSCDPNIPFPEKDTQFAMAAEMWIFAALSQKSWHYIPTSLSLKLILLTGSLLGLIIYVVYSGGIVSALSVNIIPIRSFTQLIQNKFTFTVHTRSEPLKTFMQLLIDELKLKQSLSTIETTEEISQLLNPLNPTAFFTYPDLFHQVALHLNHTEQYVCNTLYWIRYSDIPTVNGLFLRKDSEYTETFNHKLQRLKESGLNHRYAKNYDKKNSFSCIHTAKAQKYDPVTYFDLISVFCCLYIGSAASLVLLALEVLTIGIRLRHNVLKKTTCPS